jgi:hypothetical protein
MTKMNFPEMDVAAHAARLAESLRNAAPWSCTFLSGEPGCEAVGQGTKLAGAIEASMQRSFNLWANTWIKPHIDDLAMLGANRPMQARRGDRLMVDGHYLEVVSVNHETREYELDNGRVLADASVSAEMVLFTN